jgi:hypothetical protein
VPQGGQHALEQVRWKSTLQLRFSIRNTMTAYQDRLGTSKHKQISNQGGVLHTAIPRAVATTVPYRSCRSHTVRQCCMSHDRMGSASLSLSSL